MTPVWFSGEAVLRVTLGGFSIRHGAGLPYKRASYEEVMEFMASITAP